MQNDLTYTNLFTWLSSWLNPAVILPALAVLIPLFLYWRSKRRMRPTMSNIEGIFDEYGSRLLFTVISNNPAGSRVNKLFISERFLKFFFIHRRRINYQRNKPFLNPPRGETIPKYIIQGQETFVTLLDSNLVTKEAIYKLTFYTSDGSCSNVFPHQLGKLFQPVTHKPE